MPEIKVVRIHAGEREERTTSAGTKAWELFADEPAVIAARVSSGSTGEGSQLRDLAYELADGDVVESVAIDSADGRDILRHSTAHVMAQAVQQLFPEAKLGIGPPVENGFYYDFDVETPFVPEDLAKIETAMRKIIKEGQRFERRVTTDAEAIDELQDEPYKIELIGLKGGGASAGSTSEAVEGAAVEVGAGELTIYDNVRRNGDVAWSDLCRGPHLPTTKRIPAFKLMRTAAAYWRGDEKNKQLQRIYGTAWESKEALEEHLHRIEEAERRDHRKLGRELDLFSFPDEIGSGLPVFHPKGGVIKRAMEDYVRQRHIEEGFDYVGTPHIAKEGLFHTSGHLPYYGEGMFPALDVDGMDYRLKAMNCPMHNLIYRSRQRSYRDLPLRLFEFGSVYRYEKSGVVHGLTRVRGFAQDDSHSYCTPEQAPDEVAHLLDFMLSVLRDFGLDDFYLELSTRDAAKDKFIGSDEDWETATQVLEDVATRTGLELVPGPGRRGLLRPEDLRAGARRDRPHLADGHRPVRLQPALRRPLQPRVRRRRRLPPAAGDDPLGQVRLDRAVHRRAGRALRGRLPALARAGAGPGDPDRRAAQRLPLRGGEADEDAGPARRGRRLRRPDAEEDPQRAAAEGAVHDHRRRPGRGGRRGLVPLPRRPPGQRRAARGGHRAGGQRRDEPRAGLMVPGGMEPGARAPGRDRPADELERLWTPYRMAYIRGENKPTDPSQPGVPVLPGAGTRRTPTGWWCTAARRRTWCSTSTRTRRAT